MILVKYLRHRRVRESVSNYNIWAHENEERCFVDGTDSRTLFSIVVPAFNTDKLHVQEMVYSIINQHHENWELIIANASTNKVFKKNISDLSSVDSRIKVIDLEGNKGISVNTNDALAYVKGDYTVFVDHDDLLHPCALHSFAKIIDKSHPSVVYSDEDKVTDDGSSFYNPFFKPSWSPHLFENVNYINHLTAVKTTLVKKTKGLRPAFDGAQDYDLLLRVIDSEKEIIKHIPHVLYHWRAAETSTARSISTKKYVLDSGERALAEHLQRNKTKGKVRALVGRPGFYKTTYTLPKNKSVALVVGRTASEVRVYMKDWLETITKSIPNLQTIYIGDWFQDTGFDNVKISTYKEDDLGGISGIGEDVVLYCNEAFAFGKEKPLEDMMGLAITGCIVAPVILQGTTIRNTSYTIVNGAQRPTLKTLTYGEGDMFGSTEWVRNIDRLQNNILIMEKNVFVEYSKTFSQIIGPIGSAIPVLWSHDPLQSLGLLSRQSSDEEVSSSYLDESSLYEQQLFKGKL